MSQRLYNIFFHTHTISGIIISALLYVIFFTGSIAFLRDEINAWQRDQPIEENYFNTIDFDQALNNMAEDQELYGRDITFSHRYFERRVTTTFTASKDTSIVDEALGRGGNYFYMDMDSFDKKDYMENYSLGEFFYRLHFFAQLNFFGRSGYLLAGLVAFFFLFAVITGVIVHWKKIVSSFYVFRPKAKWKTIWTDAHVALGMIGLPYQFMFAVTGCYLIIGYTVMLPPVQEYIFENRPEHIEEILSLKEPVNIDFQGERLQNQASINQMVNNTLEKWPDLIIDELNISNYGDKGMYVIITGSPGFDHSLGNKAYRTYLADGSVIAEKSIDQPSGYAAGAFNILRRLHYGDFGGYGLKLIYLVLGFITCFVILSGVHIWLVARNKKNISPYKRKFNFWLVQVYTASCLSLFPVTALSFVVMKLTHQMGGREVLYPVFFYSWLALVIFFLVRRNNYFTNKTCLLIGGVLSLLVPVSNGIITGNWLWITAAKGYHQIMVVDIFWLLTALTSFAVLLKMKKRSIAPTTILT